MMRPIVGPICVDPKVTRVLFAAPAQEGKGLLILRCAGGWVWSVGPGGYPETVE